jgi:hypothetical protein
MYTQAWTKHLDTQEDKDRFYQAVMSAKPVLSRLKDMIDEKLQSMNFQETSQTNYDKPNWQFWQAHQNGFRQCLLSYSKLIDPDQKETSNDPTTQPVRI